MRASPRPKTRPPGVDRAGRTDVHYAASAGDVERVVALLAAGADAGLPDDAGWTPLHFGAQAHAPGVVSALLAAGANVDAADGHGNTPLFRATFACQGRGEVIALLRSHGADPMRVNAHGVSPVQLARTIANYDVARHFSDLPE